MEDLKQQVDRLERTLSDFLSEYYRNVNPSSEIVTKKVYFKGSTSFNNSSVGSVGDTMSVYGVTPVAQAGAIAAPNTPGAVYSQTDVQSIVTAVNAIRTAIKNFGITA